MFFLKEKNIRVIRSIRKGLLSRIRSKNAARQDPVSITGLFTIIQGIG
jgi:hypothetical protein